MAGNAHNTAIAMKFYEPVKRFDYIEQWSEIGLNDRILAEPFGVGCSEPD
jgi:hypothetical protein